MNNPKNKKTVCTVLVARLLKIMHQKNITQYELSLLSNVPYPTIKSMFQGRTKNADFTTIIKLAYGLGIKPSELIDDDKFNAEYLELI